MLTQKVFANKSENGKEIYATIEFVLSKGSLKSMPQCDQEEAHKSMSSS